MALKKRFANLEKDYEYNQRNIKSSKSVEVVIKKLINGFDIDKTNQKTTSEEQTHESKN